MGAVKMEDIIGNSNATEELDKNREEKPVRYSLKTFNIPKGKPKSGKIWKSERKRFSSIVKTKGIRDSLDKKAALRKELVRIKDASRAIKAAREEEKQNKKERRRENLRRQEENRKKSEIVQVIRNTSKIKRMKKKQLRQIEKRDTN